MDMFGNHPHALSSSFDQDMVPMAYSHATNVLTFSVSPVSARPAVRLARWIHRSNKIVRNSHFWRIHSMRPLPPPLPPSYDREPEFQGVSEFL